MAIGTMKNWPVFFLDYLKLIHSKHVVYSFKHGFIIVLRAGTTDRNIVSEVLISNVYNLGALQKGDIVVDIGAHIGTFSIAAAKVAKKVYAFEPSKENFTMLKENIAANKTDNIIAFHVAVSGTTGSRELFLHPNDPCMHSLYFKSETKSEVSTISIEDIFKQNNIDHIDYLKLDCEGAEYEILFNCPKEILKKIYHIGAECHNLDEQRTTQSFIYFLESNGFKVTISKECDRIIDALRVYI